jgi:hypothetical protein
MILPNIKNCASKLVKFGRMSHAKPLRSLRQGVGFFFKVGDTSARSDRIRSLRKARPPFLGVLSGLARESNWGPDPVRIKHHLNPRRGAALIIVLAAVVLVSILVLTFLSRSVLNRKLSFSSAGQARAEMLSRMALDTVIGDLSNEIVAGSKATTLGDEPKQFTIYEPDVDKANYTLTMVPSRILPDPDWKTQADYTNLVKVSISGRPFWGETLYSYPTADDIPQSPVRSAAGNSTKTASVNGRYVSENRWKKPQLLGGTAGFPTEKVPDWVIMTRQGAIRDALNEMPSLNQLSDKEESNEQYALGRYAYAIYDVGGLIDITVAGSPSGTSSDFKSKRGLLAQIDLSTLPGIDNPAKADALIQWRNKASTATPTDYETYVQSNTTGFTEVAKGDDTFINRQDLIRYAQKYNLTGALPYLTTFNQALNAPSYTPLPVGAGVNKRPAVQSQNSPLRSYTGKDNDFNPSLINLRTSATNGEPLLRKRFPLNRLSKVTSQATADDSSDIYQYFGLKRTLADKPWIYNHGSSNTIYTLAQVKGLTPKRDPDFFELLKSAIHLGSLAKSSESVFAVVNALDCLPDHQIIQIGVNLIDQFDTDSYPTQIEFDTDFPERPVFYGIENLPYLAQVYQTPYRFKANSGGLVKPNAGQWLQPVIWNPHADPSGVPTDGPTQFRFVVKGSAYGIFDSVGNGAILARTPIKIFPDPATDSNIGIKFSISNSRRFGVPTLLTPSVGATATGSDNQTSENPQFIGIHVGTVSAPDKKLNPASPLAPYGWLWSYVVPNPYTTYQLQCLKSGVWQTYFEMKNIAGGLATLDNSNYNPTDVTPDLANYCFQSWWPRCFAMVSDPRTDHFGAVGTFGNPDYSSNSTVRMDKGEGYQAHAAKNASNQSPQPKGWTYGGTQPYNTAANGYLHSVYVGSYSDNKSNAATHYTDPDGVLRRADGAYSSNGSNAGYPLIPGNTDSRPIVLNRSFRSVAEMAYASRGTPWKHLDFFTAESADAALLDLFSVHDDPEIVAGVINPNTRQKAVLQTLLQGAIISEKDNTTISATTATSIANALLTRTTDPTKGPLLNRSDLVTKIAPDLVYASNDDTIIKRRREAAIRALSDSSNTRTWNLLIDVVTQAGRYPANAKSNLNEFLVEGEKRYWLHVALDRYTGRVISKSLESVYE